MADEEIDLSLVSAEALRAELERRPPAETSKHIGDNWYFLVPDEAEDDTEWDGTFYFVHKRHWHLEHTIGGEIGDELSLPQNFGDQIQSSRFGYSGELEEGISTLTACGFNRLENPFDHIQAELKYRSEELGDTSLTFICDTPEIRGSLEQWLGRSHFPTPPGGTGLTLDTCRGHLRLFTAPNSFHYVITNDFGTLDDVWRGGRLSIMTSDVYASLPPELPERD